MGQKSPEASARISEVTGADFLLAGVVPLRVRRGTTWLGSSQALCFEKRGDMLNLEYISQRAPKQGYIHFEDVALLGPNLRAKANRVRAEEMHMHVTGSPEKFVFEMMMLKVRDRRGHMQFATSE